MAQALKTNAWGEQHLSHLRNIAAKYSHRTLATVMLTLNVLLQKVTYKLTC